MKPSAVAEGRIVEFPERIPPQSHSGAEVLRAVDELRSKHPHVAALGAGLPGMVDSVNVASTNFRMWRVGRILA